MPRIELIAKRQDGSQLVGRIYEMNFTTVTDNWFWGVKGLTVDMSIGGPMHGNAAGMEDAKAKLRAAFDRWLDWALAMEPIDLKYPALDNELRAIGARSPLL